MVENEPLALSVQERVQLFAEAFGKWDRRVTKVFALEDWGEPQAIAGNKLELFCEFDPEPVSDNSGYFSVLNLLLRDDEESLSVNLGITNPIEVGFLLGGKIYFPDGSKVRLGAAEHTLLWERDSNPTSNQ